MSLKPLGDIIKVEIQTGDNGDVLGINTSDKDSVNTGIVVELADQFNFFGFHSFACEDSFMQREKLDELYKYYQSLVGKRVFWTALSERGMVLREGDKKYAMIKLTDLIAVSEPEDDVYNVYGADGGSYAV